MCNAQLRGFQRLLDTLIGLNAGVVSHSVDDEDTTRALIEKHRLTFPVGHSADADKIAAPTGAFVNAEPHYLQATGFAVDPPAGSWSACTPPAPLAESPPSSFAA